MRPTLNSESVQTAAVDEIVDEARDWLIRSSIIPKDAERKEVAAAVTLAVLNGCDSYVAARYAEDIYGWAVDREFISILDRAYRRFEHHANAQTHAWVMKENVRFPAKKGEGVVFRVGDAELLGKVAAVIRREARAVVQLLGKGGHMSVNAEDVVRTVPIGNSDKGKKDPDPIIA